MMYINKQFSSLISNIWIINDNKNQCNNSMMFDQEASSYYVSDITSLLINQNLTPVISPDDSHIFNLTYTFTIQIGMQTVLIQVPIIYRFAVETSKISWISFHHSTFVDLTAHCYEYDFYPEISLAFNSTSITLQSITVLDKRILRIDSDKMTRFPTISDIHSSIKLSIYSAFDPKIGLLISNTNSTSNADMLILLFVGGFLLIFSFLALIRFAISRNSYYKKRIIKLILN